MTAPTVSSFSPADNATDVAIDATLVVTFSENVVLGASGTITLKLTSDDSTIDSWDVSADEGSGAGQCEITNSDELTLHLTTDLTNELEYYVVWDEGVVEDGAGNPVAALSVTTTWSFTTVAAAGGLLLDDIAADLGAVYSLRKLVTAYAGNCVRIRESGGDTEQDFGFVNDVVDTAGIATFIGGNSGFIVTWFDQSGNGLDVTQATAANQPAFIASAINSLPSARFDGTNDILSRASVATAVLTGTTEITAMVVQNQAGGQAQNTSFLWANGSTPVRLHATYDDVIYWDFGGASGGVTRENVNQPSGWDDAAHIVELTRTTAGAQLIMVDGVQLVLGSANTGSLDGTAATWTVGGGAGIFFEGDISELIVCQTDIGSTVRDAIRADQGTYFGVSL